MQVRVLGAHLPRLDQAGVAAFIRDDVLSFKRTMAELIQNGTIKGSSQDVEERALELPAELGHNLQRCALFELEVQGNDAEFDPSAYGNPDSGALGWAPAFLSLDGTSVVAEAYKAHRRYETSGLPSMYMTGSCQVALPAHSVSSRFHPSHLCRSGSGSSLRTVASTSDA